MNREILVAVTFRDFIGDENELIQRKFLESIESQSYKNFRLVVTIFNEKNIGEIISEYDINVEYVYDESDIRHSFSRVIRNVFPIIEKGKNIVLYTNADIIFEKNYFEKINYYFLPGYGGTSFPQIYYKSIDHFINEKKYDKINDKYIKSDFSIDPNIYVPDTVFCDGDCFLNNEVNNWWSKNDIIGPWPGMAQSLMVAYNGKRLINLYFKTKVKTIENVKENERKEVDELKLKNRLKITSMNKQIMFNYAKLIGIRKKYFSKRIIGYHKFKQIANYSIIGNLPERIRFYFYLFYFFLFPRKEFILFRIIRLSNNFIINRIYNNN